ncbi:hypothetical protein BDY21DRAFT_410541 [Lineolata rhizophorae]|uniref:Uncharacterized protein n=1 Tax=Lineolata rhizophorae TaxID=578093 RepID=A0A6A6P3Y4_9PEZI|nr:hypothetical protein BDY21DRAFT_410541 [Lineolata rhizophorae]
MRIERRRLHSIVMAEEPKPLCSPPLKDLDKPWDPSPIRGLTILITGGASGFGAAFAREWAKLGATVVIGDVDDEKGEALAKEFQGEGQEEEEAAAEPAKGASQAAEKGRIHFLHCDVRSWESQAALFKEAIRLSPHGGIDTVVANAGVARPDCLLKPPARTDPATGAEEPLPPDFLITDVNAVGALYTAHLALFYLPRNPGSAPATPWTSSSSSSSGSGSGSTSPAAATAGRRDRHLLLVGSVASLMPVAGLPQYCAAKHALVGLFRALRLTAAGGGPGVRANMVCPYFVDTPLLTRGARLLLAGGALGRVEDVLDAAGRLVAGGGVVGRAVVVGPRGMKGSAGPPGMGVGAAEGEDAEGEVVECALWEAYADDWEVSEVWNRGVIRMINRVAAVRGWIGWAGDLWSAFWARDSRL